MVGWQFDDGQRLEADCLDCCRHVSRFHPQLCLRTTWLTENGCLLPRPSVPVDHYETSTRPQGCGNGAGKSGFVGNTVEGIGDQHPVCRLRLHHGLNASGVSLYEFAIYQSRIGEPRFCFAKHHGINVNADDPMCDPTQRQREISVTTAKINDTLASLNTELSDDSNWIRPEGLPPIGIRH
jgi:hypothetical protein